MTCPKPHSRSAARLHAGKDSALRGVTSLSHPNTPSSSSSHLLQAIELLVEQLIIPLDRAELVAVHTHKGIEEVGAQMGVYILGHEASSP